MLKSRIFTKVLAIFLVFTLTFSNFAFVSESLASTFFDNWFGTAETTGHKNVEFEAYLGSEQEDIMVSDVNAEDLAISLNLNVRNSGYLKEGRIAIESKDEDEKLNFKLKGDIEESEIIQDVEDDVISLKQIDYGTDVDLDIPIEYKNEEYVNETKFSRESKVVFTGIYVDKDGEETEISKKVPLLLIWEDKREVNLSSEITKYIAFEMGENKGIILQTSVNVDSYTENNTLPILSSEVNITVPSIDGKSPSTILVVAESTAGTNGKADEQVVFGEDNWKYNEYENLLTIFVKNEKELVEFSNAGENDNLVDGEEELEQEERYYAKPGIDTYTILYTYENISIPEILEISSNVSAKLNLLNSTSSNEATFDYSLNGQTGDIVSFNINNETSSVSKAYTYINYNQENKYEINYNSKTIVNVSYKDIVEGIILQDLDSLYVASNGNSYVADDVYYKEISINKDNFINLLGEDGIITIKNTDDVILAVISNETEINEDGNFVVTFGDRVSKLMYELSKPVAEGNLIISSKKASTNSMYSRDEFKDFEKLFSRMKCLARYTYVEDIVDLGVKEIYTELENTSTKANLVLERDSLSTLAPNDNVEMRIELGNDKDTSDVYSYSVFDIVMPDYVQNVDILDFGIMYGEGLYISNIEKFGNTIRIIVDGKQEALSSGVLNNGTNIVLNTNITVDMFTPATKGAILLNYENSNATNYADGQESILFVDYSAPTGVVVVNTAKNYNDLGKALTSIRQGSKVDEIAKNSDARVATMEIVVMNNNNNSISDLKILGRIPFDGVKDIQTGEDLGANVNTRLVSNVTPDEKNGTEFRVYYSENGEATADLQDGLNNWSEEITENTKSYLIIPVDENFEMQSADVLKFTYNYEIPAGLTFNKDIASTFVAYYTNNTEIAKVAEEAKADLVSLSTGTGPELKVRLTSNATEKVKNEQEIIYKIEVINDGKIPARNVNVNFPLSLFGMNFVDAKADEDVIINLFGFDEDNEDIYETEDDEEEDEDGFEIKDDELIQLIQLFEDGDYDKIEELYGSEMMEYLNSSKPVVQFVIPEIDVNSSKELIVKVSANFIQDSMQIKAKATVTADDLDETIESETISFEVEETMLEIRLESDLEECKLSANSEVEYDILAKNNSQKEVNNVVVKMKLPDEVSYKNAYLLEVHAQAEGGEYIPSTKNESVAYYDDSSRIVSFNLGTLGMKEYRQLRVIVLTKELEVGSTLKEVVATASVSATNCDEIISNQTSFLLAKSSLIISQISATSSTYVIEGNTIEYIFKVKNEGTTMAKDVTIVDYIPEGLLAKSIVLEIEGKTTSKSVSGKTNPQITIPYINSGEEWNVHVITLAKNLKGMQELTVTNNGSVISETMSEPIMSNDITHIIKANPNKASNYEESVPNTGATANLTSSAGNIVKTYKITGVAWLDENRDGMRAEEEMKMTDVTARLVNTDTGVIVKSVTTDSKGNYVFNGIENGNYIIVFDYDTVKYTVTTYKKAGIEESLNSDAITTKIEQDGKQRNAAVSDAVIVRDSSVSGIDIGFVYADTFDLSLEKTITKITVQNKAGTSNTKFDHTTLAQMPIQAKYLSGSTVYIEYSFKVSNLGEIAGFAKKIVDYIPQGMTFNSSLNKDWYTGTDGNLYTTVLADTELKSGETKEIKLVLTKQMTEENTGLVNNLSEIAEDYNIYGVSDKNSTPLNKAQGENDLGSADAIITVRTGDVFIYVSIIITSIILGAVVVFIAYTKIKVGKRRGGV